MCYFAVHPDDNARHALARLNLIAITTSILDTAATLSPPEVRTLDAIHLAAALVVPDLRALVTYDRRLTVAATQAGLPVVSPS